MAVSMRCKQCAEVALFILLLAARFSGVLAQDAGSAAERAEDSLVSMAHAVELGRVCEWTTDSPQRLHQDLQRVSTQFFQDQILHGQLVPVEANNVQATFLLPVSFRLLARNAGEWKKSGDCRDKDWRAAWDLFEQLRRALPADAPLLVRVREESRQHVAHLRAKSCITQAIWLLDDRLSGADVVANAVREACRDELREQLSVSLINSESSAAFTERQVDRLFESEELVRKLSATVLDVRASGTNARAR
jgi:hypothetical protein